MANVGKGQAGSMKKTAGGGYFMVPAGPVQGTPVSTPATSDTYGSWVEMIASTSAPIYIVGFTLDPVGTTIEYVQLDIGTGAAASEASVSEWKVDFPSIDNQAETVTFPFPIPVATATRIACRTADQENSVRGHLVALICINQSDLVDL